MYLAGRWADRQLSRLELVIVVIVFSLILTVFIQYMLRVFAIAERSLMLNSITNMNTALQYNAAAYALTGNYAGLAAMQGMNPFALAGSNLGELTLNSGEPTPHQLLSGMVIMRVPGNYIGELDSPDPADIEGGHWYFDTRDSILVYRVDNAEYFQSNLPGAPRVQFQVQIEYTDRNNNNEFDPGIDTYMGIRLRALNEYGWEL
jgi:hypothetical protein